MPEVDVVGAGVAGLAAATQLVAAGVTVRVIDKADRPGGRLAALVLGGRPAATAATQTHVGDDAEVAGLLASWGAKLDGGVARFGDPWALTSRAAADLVVERGLVTAVGRDGDRGVTEVEATRRPPVAAVVVTAPTPQARAVLARGGLDIPSAYEPVRYAARDVLLVTLATPVELPPIAPPFERWHTGDGTVHGHTTTVVAHAAPGAVDPGEDATSAQAQLLAALLDHLGARAEAGSSRLKRWRYAAPDVGVEGHCAQVTGAPIWLAGDAHGGTAPVPGRGIADAVRSGLAAAAAVTDHLRR